LAQSLRLGSAAGLEKAASKWSWEPFYSLEAGAQTWRQGLAAQDAAAVARGRALVQQGVAGCRA